MFDQKLKLKKRKKRQIRTRTKIQGSSERPRVSLRCSHRNLFVQLIDDFNNRTLLSLSTLDQEIKSKAKSRGNIEGAKLLGDILSKRAKEKAITKVVFDKSHYLYHGKVKAFADSARQGGLEF